MTEQLSKFFSICVAVSLFATIVMTVTTSIATGDEMAMKFNNGIINATANVASKNIIALAEEESVSATNLYKLMVASTEVLKDYKILDKNNSSTNAQGVTYTIDNLLSKPRARYKVSYTGGINSGFTVVIKEVS